MMSLLDPMALRLPLPDPDAFLDATRPIARAVFSKSGAVAGGAGILVEIFLAAIAMIVWANAQPGLLRAFGIRDAESPVTGRGEAPWLFCHAIAAFCCRLFITLVIALLIGTGFFLFALPLPHATLPEGVVRVRGEAAVHAGAEGVVAELAARVAELEALNLARADLALARERLDQRVIRSHAEGRLSLHRPDDLVGRFVRKGGLIGPVARFEDPVIRVVVPEAEADLVPARTRGVAPRLASARAEVLQARIERISPRLEASVPSPALTTGRGAAALGDPTAPDRGRTLGRYLRLDLAPEPGALAAPRFGERVHVRFAHDEEPVAHRLCRPLRQVFLRHFEV
jgi:hypothetical protein